MARPRNTVPKSKGTFSLTKTQLDFLENRAKEQTLTLKARKQPRARVYPSDLVGLAILFYQMNPDLVENYLEWKGATPITWPSEAGPAEPSSLSENVDASQPAEVGADSPGTSEQPTG